MSDETETPEADEDEGVSQPTTDDADESAEDLDDDLDAEDGDEQAEEGDEDELEDVEWEGKTVRVPAAVKAALLRQADYTRKTQEVAEQRKALDAEREALTKQATASKEITEGRVQFDMIGRQIKVVDEKISELEADDDADQDQLNRLWRDAQRLRNRQIELATDITQKQNALELERKRDADAARAKAVQETQAVLRKDIKGWNNDLAVKVGEFAVTRLGMAPQEVLNLTDPRLIKALHGAYVGDQAQRKLRQQQKLEAGDKTAPVRSPGGGGAAPNSRRTTDASGDKLTTDEWIRREQAREAAKRAKR